MAGSPATEFAVFWTQHGEQVEPCIANSRNQLQSVRKRLQEILNHYRATDHPPVQGARPKIVKSAAQYVAAVRQQAARIEVNIKRYNLSEYGAILRSSLDADTEHLPEPHARHFARVKRAQASEAFIEALGDELERACELYARENPYLVANDLERFWSTVEESMKQIDEFLQDH